MDQMTPEQLKKATADLSDKLLSVTFESEQPFVVNITALLTATIGYATTALKAIADEQAREQVAIHVGGMILKGVETIMESGGMQDAEEANRK